MSLEAHANPGPRLSSDKDGLWAILVAWSKEAEGAGKLPQLLRSYTDVAPRGVESLDSLFRAACAAAMDILSDVILGVKLLPCCLITSPEHKMLGSQLAAELRTWFAWRLQIESKPGLEASRAYTRHQLLAGSTLLRRLINPRCLWSAGNEAIVVVVQSNAALSGLQQDAQRLAAQGISPGRLAAKLRSAAQAVSREPRSSRGAYAEQLKQLLQTHAPQARVVSRPWAHLFTWSWLSRASRLC